MGGMRRRLLLIPASLVCVLSVLAAGQAQTRQRINHVIAQLEQKQPVFGVYWPTNPSGRGRAGAPPPAPVAPKSPGELAREALAYRGADFLFSGALEGGIDRGIGAVTDFITATAETGASAKSPLVRAPSSSHASFPSVASSNADN